MNKLGVCVDCKKNSENVDKVEEDCAYIQEVQELLPKNEELLEKNYKVVPIIAGRCQYHYKVFRAKECAERNKDKVRKLRAPIKRNGYVKKDPAESENLVLWYAARMRDATGRCQECGEPISIFDRHSSMAHVLPKRKEHGFPSVATHEENCMELGTRCGCHHRYDNNWDKASKMKIFPIAVEKFKILYPFLSQEERARIPDVFLKYVE